MSNEHQAMFAYLRSLNFHFLDTWVIDCMNYYKSMDRSISFQKLKDEVHQQWLLVNLRDIKVPSLPPNLASYDKLTLPGKYAVQVETMVDSSQSSYSQLQTLQNVDLGNIDGIKKPTEWEPQPKRCLTMMLCDGVQEVKAMEYQQIKSLKLNDVELLPGFKIIIIGPVVCRKGMLLLKEENVKVCGGEVDILTETNRLESLLMRKLGLNEEANRNQANAGNNPNRNETHSYSPVEEPEVASQLENLNELLNENDDDLLMNLSIEENENQVVNNVASETPANAASETSYHENIINTDDWEDMDLDFNGPEIIGNLSSQQPSTSGWQGTSLKNNQNQTDVNFQSNKNLPKSGETVPSVTRQSSGSNMRNAMNVSASSSNMKQSSISSFFTTDVTKKTNAVKPQPSCSLVQKPKSPVEISPEPFVYLKSIMDLDLSQAKIFTVKAVILTLKTKVAIKNDRFTLKANISDGSLSLDVDFSSNILEDFLGFSPCEFTVMLKEKSRNSAIADRIKAAFQKMQVILISLNCLMRIRFQTGTTPCVLSVEEVQVKHLNALKARRLT